MRLQKQSILDSIKKEQKITDETEKALRLALQSFNDLHHEWTI